jgi:hypothetical protein
MPLPAKRALLALLVLYPSAMLAQSSQSASSPSVPRLINITGVFRPANGQPAAAVETVTLSIYADQEGGAPVWQETQTIALDAQGRYALILGSTHPEGIPAAVFGAGEAKWLGTVFERAGEVEGPRIRITSVPYALRASDADTLGGRPASDYQLTTGATVREGSSGSASVESTPGESANLVQPGVQNFLAKYLPGGADVGTSAVYEAGGKVGIGTSGPADFLHVAFNDPNGTVTGYAVQNTALSPGAYSGMLFYDHTGALGQFQGFNNSTHEYRINNIGRVSQPSGAFNGSINFMIGSVSRFFVGSNGNIGIGTTSPSANLEVPGTVNFGVSRFIVAPNGNVGIGTTAPSALLEVSNAVPGGPANMWTTSYTNAIHPYYMARRARGTLGAPLSVLSGDGLAGFYGEGFGTTAFGGGFAGGMTVQAAQNWTDTAHGTALVFTNTPINATAAMTRMTLDASGNLGIGTSSTLAASILEFSNATSTLPFAQATASTFASSGQGSLFVGRKARGTAAAPSAVQSGDVLVGVLGRGYAATNFNGTGHGGMFVRAAETWTDTAQGTSVAFNTTMVGTTVPLARMTIVSNGNIGIGTGGPSEAVEVLREGQQGAGFLATTYGAEQTNGGGAFLIRNARGTAAAPAAVQLGDSLGYFVGNGYGTSGFGDEFAGGMVVVAAENWTDAAQGTLVALMTTPVGSNEGAASVAVMPNGNVGIGTFTEIPTIADRLQVFGDIRVGTSGTNGCIRSFGGNTITGSCSSDRRFKKDITPFDHVLDRVTALQPVHYFWRASEFPDRQFGARRTYGLIAQDVEQVLPELVVTNEDGYKAVDYSELPLLTIQAVKDLKAENDALKLRVAELEKLNPEALKQRLADLERLVETLAAANRR